MSVANNSSIEQLAQSEVEVSRNIPKGWDETTLGEIIDTANTGLDAIKRAPIVEEETGVKCFRIQDASQKKKYENWGNTKVEDKNYQKFKLIKGDILIARTGNTIGVNHLVKEDIKSVFNNGLIRLRVNDKCDYIYLYKIIESRLFGRYVQSIAYGTSTQPNMQINVLLGFDLLLPPLPEQKAIAQILTSFDDKIELLQAQNKTLETTAQTIFKEWFASTPLSNHSERETERSRSLPEGWRVGKLGDIAYNHSSSFKFSEEKVVFINTGDVSKGQFLHSNKISPKNLPGQAKKAIELHDILYSEIRPKNKRFAFVDFETPNYVVSTKFMIIRPKDSFSPFILYFILKSKEAIDEFNIVAESRSGTFPQITFNAIESYPIVFPPKEILNKFETLLKTIMNKQKLNNSQIQTLKKTRDTLLPKLMNGSLRVDEFKK